MSITLFGVPPSSYVRTARMTCVEKGVDHTLELVELGSGAHHTLHPFSKVPILKHGDVTLYETSAIVRYIDQAFEGPSLQPKDPVEQARVDQWISVINCYAYNDLIVNYGLKYIFAKDGGPDRAVIDAAVPNLERDLGLFERGLEGQDWLAGTFSLADTFVGPVISTIGKLPEAGKILDRSPNLRRWMTSLEQRKSAEFLNPPIP